MYHAVVIEGKNEQNPNISPNLDRGSRHSVILIDVHATLRVVKILQFRNRLHISCPKHPQKNGGISQSI